MQYKEWEEEYKSLDGLSHAPAFDPTGEIAVRMELLSRKMKYVREAATASDEYLAPWIFRSVTTGATFTTFEAEGVPFGRDMFYDRLRKFFYILDKLRE